MSAPRRSPPRRRAGGRTPVSRVGVVRVTGTDWTYWVAYRDGRDPAACLARPPTAAGWVQVNPVASLVGAVLGMVFDFEEDPGVAAAAAWLRAHRQYGDPLETLRDDALAVNAYLRAGSPAPPAARAAPAPAPAPEPQPPWWVAELGCAWPPRRAQVVEAHRARAHATHPDRPGGNAASFARVTRAYEAAIGWVAEREERGG